MHLHIAALHISMNFKLKPPTIAIQFIDQSIRNQQSKCIPAYYRKRIWMKIKQNEIFMNHQQTNNAREFEFNETNYHIAENENSN